MNDPGLQLSRSQGNQPSEACGGKGAGQLLPSFLSLLSPFKCSSAWLLFVEASALNLTFGKTYQAVGHRAGGGGSVGGCV